MKCSICNREIPKGRAFYYCPLHKDAVHVCENCHEDLYEACPIKGCREHLDQDTVPF